MNNKRCGNCGSTKINEVSIKGPFPWKDFPMVFLAQGIPMLKCSECGETMMPASLGVKLDEAITESISTQVREFISQIMQREKAMQTELSQRLGVTPEYLSEIKSGRKIPSFQTFNFLKVLAQDKKAYAISDPGESGAASA